MSYQEIYKGMIKQASAEQVKELAGVIKVARMNKNAGIPLPAGVKVPFLSRVGGFFTGHYKPSIQLGQIIPNPTYDLKFSIPGMGKATWGHLKKHPLAYGLTGAGLIGTGTGLTAYNWTDSSLKGALERAEKKAQGLNTQNKALKKGSGSLWQDLLNAIKLAWERWFPAKDTNTAVAQTKAPAKTETKG